MDTEQLIKRIFDDVINEGNLDAAHEYFAEDFVDHGPMGDMRGVPAFKEMVAMWRAAVPDVHCEVESVFSEGDMAAWLVRTTGTHTGEMMGMPPSGKPIDLVSPNIARIHDGKAVEHWADQSMFQFLQQIGAMQPPGVATDA